jgi:Flp pilus assembly pilin Flp
MRQGNSRYAPALRRLLPLLRDERGGEAIEWALVAGLVVIGALAVIGAFGTKVLARWTTVNGSM